MSAVRNEVLYHFVGWGSPNDDEKNFQTLCKVLDSGQIGRPGMPGCQIIVDPHRNPSKGELIQQSITCYCDIEFDDLDLHVSKYGKFGVGLDRRKLSEFGARTVMYVPYMSRYPGGTGGHRLMDDLRMLLRGISQHLEFEEGETTRVVGKDLESKEEVIEQLESAFNRDFLAFLKFYDGSLPIDHPDYFYTEREWRKFGSMPLNMSMRELIVPLGFKERLEQRYPQYANMIRPLPF